MKHTIMQYKSEFLHDNFSDHVPLMISLNIDVEFHLTYERDFKPSVAWHKCDENHENNYKNTLDQLLLKINPKIRL